MWSKNLVIFYGHTTQPYFKDADRLTNNMRNAKHCFSLWSKKTFQEINVYPDCAHTFIV